VFRTAFIIISVILLGGFLLGVTAVWLAHAGSHTLGPGGEYASGLIGLLGRLHPLSVHFPVALIFAAGLAEIFYMRRGNNAFGFAARFALLTAAACAVVSVLLGFAAAAGRASLTDSAIQIGFHGTMGLATAGLVSLTAALAVSASHKRDPFRVRLYRTALAVTMIVVGFAAHTGAMLVFGPNYFSIF